MFENSPEIRETSPVSIKKILQQLKIQNRKNGHSEEAIDRNGSQILWKLLQQWSLPRKNKSSLHLFFLRMILSQGPRHWRRKKGWYYLVTEEFPSANTCTCPRISVVSCVQFGKWTRNAKVVCYVPELNLSLQNAFPVMLSFKPLLWSWLLTVNPPMSLPPVWMNTSRSCDRNMYIKCNERLDSGNTSAGSLRTALGVGGSFGPWLSL